MVETVKELAFHLSKSCFALLGKNLADAPALAFNVLIRVQAGPAGKSGQLNADAGFTGSGRTYEYDIVI